MLRIVHRATTHSYVLLRAFGFFFLFVCLFVCFCLFVFLWGYCLLSLSVSVCSGCSGVAIEGGPGQGREAEVRRLLEAAQK